MTKMIDLNDTVFELCSKYPEIQDILIELGFKDLGIPGMLKTAGRFMTLPKGAAVKKIDLELVKQTFRNKGYDVLE